ncbi:MAG: hypothetical protein GC199_02475 [Alphaproteobacteria bacterium]|nr:hypothetical protein [Alphaproteobacteria bacterium]
MPGLSFEAAFHVLGAGFTAFVILAVTRRALALARPNTWERRAPMQPFPAFAWSEFGAGLFYGFMAATGLGPFVLFVFGDTANFFTTLALVGAMIWLSFAILFYFIGLAGGFVGYVAYTRGLPGGAEVNVYSQLLVVLVFSAPLLYVFIAYLAGPLSTLIGLAIESARTLAAAAL